MEGGVTVVSNEERARQKHSVGGDPEINPPLSLDEVRDRTCGKIGAALRSEESTLIEALPGTGKSHGVIKAAAQTGEPITILTGRGRGEQYEQIEDWCEQYGLEELTLPSAKEECPTLNGDHTGKAAKEAGDRYGRGASASDLHEEMTLPCDGEEPCSYREAWDFEPDEYPVLIGHYTHAYVPKVVKGRTVVVDEFPEGAYTETVGTGAITRFLKQTDEIPANRYDELSGLRPEGVRWFTNRGLDLDDSRGVATDDSGDYHAKAPLATLAVLTDRGPEIAGRWGSPVLSERQRAAHDRDKGEVIVLDPPDFSGANGVVALDGTPTKELWDLALGRNLTHERVLSDEERHEYVTRTQNLQIVQTSAHVLPCSSGEYVGTDRDAALTHEVAKRHGETPGVITSKTALEALEERAGVEVADASTTYYGNVKGSNRLDDQSAGVVLGSPHYGDPYVEKWAALAGEPVVTGENRGPGESYGLFGDTVLHHMREHAVLQAIFRFARVGDGATVYVNTSAVPDWVPLAAGPEGCTVEKWSPGKRDFLEALDELEEGRASEIASTMTEGMTTRGARKIGADLTESGVVEKRPDPTHQQATLYEIGTESPNPFGLVELPRLGGDEGKPGTDPYRDLIRSCSGFIGNCREGGSVSNEKRKEWAEQAMRRKRRERESVQMTLARSSAQPSGGI